jgi:hypothetical protein
MVTPHEADTNRVHAEPDVFKALSLPWPQYTDSAWSAPERDGVRATQKSGSYSLRVPQTIVTSSRPLGYFANFRTVQGSMRIDSPAMSRSLLDDQILVNLVRVG